MRKLSIVGVLLASLIALVTVRGAALSDPGLLPPTEPDPLPPDEIVEEGEKTEHGIEYSIDFIVGYARFLLGQVTDCATGAELPPSAIFTEFFFREGAARPYNTDDLEKVIVRAPGYEPFPVTQFSSFSTSMVIVQIRFLMPAEPQICLVQEGGDESERKDEIGWEPGRPLTWDDFKGRPPEGAEESEEAAKIVSGLGYTFGTSSRREGDTWTEHLTQVAATNTMDRDASWVVPDQRSPGLLNHEQKHFDLDEVYRRLLDAELQGLVCHLEATGSSEQEARDNLNAKLDEIYKRFNEKCDEVQRQYDRETDHGRDEDKQAEWDRMIAEWLADPSKAPQP